MTSRVKIAVAPPEDVQAGRVLLHPLILMLKPADFGFDADVIPDEFYAVAEAASVSSNRPIPGLLRGTKVVHAYHVLEEAPPGCNSASRPSRLYFIFDDLCISRPAMCEIIFAIYFKEQADDEFNYLETRLRTDMVTAHSEPVPRHRPRTFSLTILITGLGRTLLADAFPSSNV